MSDTYRTDRTAPEPARLCYDCSHARLEMQDGHISQHRTRLQVFNYKHQVRCAASETKVYPETCPMTGMTKGPHMVRKCCPELNPDNDCEDFEEVTKGERAPRKRWHRVVKPEWRDFARGASHAAAFFALLSCVAFGGGYLVHHLY